ncbi:MAG: hypothetical protein R8M45_04345 [Ghiorsea sp.]
MKFDVIDTNNFLIYATKQYDASRCIDIAEFNQDLRRFDSIKRLIAKMQRGSSKVNIRLLLNHVTIVSNLFGVIAGAKLLFGYCDRTQSEYIATLLNFLNILPDSIDGYDLEHMQFIESMQDMLDEL